MIIIMDIENYIIETDEKKTKRPSGFHSYKIMLNNVMPKIFLNRNARRRDIKY